MIKRVLKKIKMRLKYPGISISQSTKILGSGNFSYGKNCIIDGESTVVVSGSLTIGENVIILKDTDVDAQEVMIGSNVSIQKHSFLLGNIKIGSFCVFAPNVFISSGGHEFKKNPPLNIRDQDTLVKDMTENNTIKIGEDCWFGINVVVLPGVSVGKGCVIGANAVVTKSIPPYSIVVGAPAKVVSKRLEFLPPKTIIPSAKFIPYLYSGFDTRMDKIANREIFLLSHMIEFFLDTKGESKVEIYLKNCTYCIVNSKRISVQNNVIIFPPQSEDGLILVTFDKNEYKKIRVLKICTS